MNGFIYFWDIMKLPHSPFFTFEYHLPSFMFERGIKHFFVLFLKFIYFLDLWIWLGVLWLCWTKALRIDIILMLKLFNLLPLSKFINDFPPVTFIVLMIKSLYIYIFFKEFLSRINVEFYKMVFSSTEMIMQFLILNLLTWHIIFISV